MLRRSFASRCRISRLRGVVVLFLHAGLCLPAYAGVNALFTAMRASLSSKDLEGDEQQSFADNRGLLEEVTTVVRYDVDRALKTKATAETSPYGGKVYRTDGGQTGVETDPDSRPLHVRYLGQQGQADVYLAEDGGIASVIAPGVMRLFTYPDGSIAAFCQYDSQGNERWEIGDPGYRLRYDYTHWATDDTWALDEHDEGGVLVARWSRADVDGIERSDLLEEHFRPDGTLASQLGVFSKATDPGSTSVAIRFYAEDGSYREDHFAVDREDRKVRRREYDATGSLTSDVELELAEIGYTAPEYSLRRVIFLEARHPGSLTMPERGPYLGLPGYYLPGEATSGQLRLDIDGYPSRLVDWELGEAEPFRHVEIDPGVYSGDKGSLAIETAPTAGAEVTINGARVGTSPYLLEYHGHERVFDIRVEKSGIVLEKTYAPQEAVAEELRLALDAEPRTYAISTTPSGASVRCNGEEVGTTPCSFEAIGATQEVEVRLRYYETITKTYTEAPGAHIEESYTLETSWADRRDDIRKTGFQIGFLVRSPGPPEAQPRLGPFYGASVKLSGALRGEPVTLDLGLELGFAGTRAEVTTAASAWSIEASAALGIRTWIRASAALFAKAGIVLGVCRVSDELAEAPVRWRIHLGPELCAGFRLQTRDFGVFAEGVAFLGLGPAGLGLYPGLRTGVYVGMGD